MAAKLFTIMGTGCESVTRVHADGVDFVTGTWKGGRVGTFRGIRAAKPIMVRWSTVPRGMPPPIPRALPPMSPKVTMRCSCRSRRSSRPVSRRWSAEETIELFAFMEAADESKRQGGKPVTLESVLAKAKAEVAARSSASK